MNRIDGPVEFTVNNFLRGAILVLAFTELYLVGCWLFPSPYHAVFIAGLLCLLPVAFLATPIRRTLDHQIFDRIRLTDEGVEYTSGLCGEEWLRPYNEFRVVCRQAGWIPGRYHVALKHRVLSTVSICTTFDRRAATEIAQSLTESSPLKMSNS